jgi:hypothetical protein
VSAAETERLRRVHREAVAAAKAVPDFAKRLELLQRCDEGAENTADRASEDRQMTRTAYRPEPNAFQRLIAAVAAADERRIEDEATRVVLARLKSKPRHPAQKAQSK